ncbi:hypothetical protein [Mucilaginibacter aquaedulcis]|uniref:hypothetical protein n=1 Tax=Mucilaginibacter aquaedulcis TaxID=1187081 RepID=UPI0025B46C56|nr:hypothetical protein [Mucilaginibacter aquaedulcis]MDN3548196.1 hypothetical protein [Mucilaginibacter aquaedulcis]
MPLLPEKLRILTFPQRITGRELDLNILILPTQALLNDLKPFDSLLTPGTQVSLPSFIGGDPKFQINVIKGLSSYPFSDANVLKDEGVTSESFPTNIAFPANMVALYEGLSKSFPLKNGDGSDSLGAGDAMPDTDGAKKYLPQSYRSAFNYSTPRTPFAKTDDSYHCAIKRTGPYDPTFKQSGDEVSWGRIIAICLRQPLLSKSIGLLHNVKLTLPTDNYFQNGGWVNFELLDPAGTFGLAATELKQYAARIPVITEDRQLFAALLFPVVPGPAQPVGGFDELMIETADYDDGFAKIVHAIQPKSANTLSEEPDGMHVQKDAGIRLGWDDEQLLIWLNRQLLADPLTPTKRIDAPLGVFSYRVDVKESDKDDWNSLVNTISNQSLMLASEQIAPAGQSVETGVQVFPSKVNPTSSLWLPSYFTQWYGASLVLPDKRVQQLDASGALAEPGKYSDSNIKAQPNQTGGLYDPVLPQNCELKYGKAYDFRVRLADLSGGGPVLSDPERNDSPSPHSSIVFQRYVAPKQVVIKPQSAQPDPNASATTFLTGDDFDIFRPRLGYPALLFTQMDTEQAFQKLIDDKNLLHTDKAPGEHIKDQREVSYFDPDVDSVFILVELKTLTMDNAASISKSEAFIPLYTTVRKFPTETDQAFNLQLEYRDANVIDFGNEIDLGDLQLSKVQIDEGNTLVVPTSRDIRITIFPNCTDKEDSPEYFSFDKTLFAGELKRVGESIQFFVRKDAVAEKDLFLPTLVSKQLQGLYLQPDPVPVNNSETLVSDVVAGVEGKQSTIMQRLASQLELNFKGMSLLGKPGERVQFACSNRIRHTLAPDNSSISFATTGELFDHWLCVSTFNLQRDWTWDGLQYNSFEIVREKQFTDEAATSESETVGYVETKRTASREAINNPERSYTRIVFIDAVEPKKDQTKPTTIAAPFPNSIEVQYTIKPSFIPAVAGDSVANNTVVNVLSLPCTVIPVQVPKVVAAGIALSPYHHNDNYSETAVRQRCLWLEFEEAIADPNDTYFARILTYAPDPLLSFPNPDASLTKQEDPPLAIDPELIRVITKDHGNDNAGIDAMQPMIMEIPDSGAPLIKVSPVHYILPLPEGLHYESPELFGFFTYELRVGHTNKIWSTANGRFGHPARINGVQHAAPSLKCLVERNQGGIVVTAQYATAVFNGKNVTAKPPRTEIWAMLYAQVKQADNKENRNILLAESRMIYQAPQEQIPLNVFLANRNFLAIKDANNRKTNDDAPLIATTLWSAAEIDFYLKQFNLRGDVGLSVLTVEMMPRYEQFIYKNVYGGKSLADDSINPLSAQLGQYRILRTSRLVAAPEICCENCD